MSAIQLSDFEHKFTNPSDVLHDALTGNNVLNAWTLDQKTALAMSVENVDVMSIKFLVNKEYEFHKNDKLEGIRCIQKQLTHNDEDTGDKEDLTDYATIWTLQLFDDKYAKSILAKLHVNIVKPLLRILPQLTAIFTFIYDCYSDVVLTQDYYRYWRHVEDGSTVDGCIKLRILSNATNLHEHHKQSQDCGSLPIGKKEYQTAFFYNIMAIALPIVCLWRVGGQEIMKLFNEVFQEKQKSQYFDALLSIIAYSPLAIFGFLLLILRYPYYNFKAARPNIRKSEYTELNRKLKESEYNFGMVRLVETGIESTWQIILQVKHK